MQMSFTIVNNATSGGGKVLSVARLEMVKYRTKGSKSSYLEDNYRVSGNTEIGRPMTVLATDRACARRWNVREILFPKLVRASQLVGEGPRETQISDEAKSRTILQSLPAACPGKRGRLVTPPKEIFYYSCGCSYLSS